MPPLFDWLQKQNWTEVAVLGGVLSWAGRRAVASLKRFVKEEFETHRAILREEYYRKDIAEERHQAYLRRISLLETHPANGD
jgi:hypothetical protein